MSNIYSSIATNEKENESPSKKICDESKGLKHRRNFYSESQRKKCLSILREHKYNQESAIREINSVPGWEALTTKSLRTWLKKDGVVERKGGALPPNEFDEEVKQYMFVKFSQGLKDEKLFDIYTSIAFSRNIIKFAAITVQSRLNWKDHDYVSKLKFTDPWISGFLKRNKFSRKKITSTSNISLLNGEVQNTIKDIKIQSEGKKIYNMDETAVNFSRPTHVYVSKTEKKIPALIPEKKNRITAVLTVGDDGEMLPVLFILKSSAKPENIEKFYEKLLRKKKFNEWSLVSEYTPFLRHNDGHIAIANKHAWMNEQIMIFYIKKLFSVFAQKHSVLLMDNFSAHKTEAVKEELWKSGTKPLYMLPNSTNVCQPLDVLVNGVLKRGLKQEFFNKIKKSVSRYHRKILTNNYLQEQNSCTMYSIPKQAINDYILLVIKVLNTNLQTEEMKRSIKKTFYDIGYKESQQLIPVAEPAILDLITGIDVLSFED